MRRGGRRFVSAAGRGRAAKIADDNAPQLRIFSAYLIAPGAGRDIMAAMLQLRSFVSFAASRFLPLAAAPFVAEFALAQDAAGEGSALASFVPLILIMAVFYWLLIRPQQKRAKAHRSMLEALAVGDEVLTSGGMFGKVLKITDNAVILEVGKTEIPFQKQSIQSLLPAGSLEKL